MFFAFAPSTSGEQYGSVKASQVVIPAKAGIQWALGVAGRWMRCLDSRLRGNDEIMRLCA